MDSLTRIRDIVLGVNAKHTKNLSFLFPIIPYDSLIFKKRQGWKKKIIKYDLHTGFDTETDYNGNIVLLMDSNGRSIWFPTLEKILQFLTYREYRNSINWYYNLTFDVESVLKMLPETELSEIIEDNQTTYKDYKITYLPHKYFKIASSHKHSVEFFDIAQFYGTSLNNASKEYLNDKKDDIEIKGIMEYVEYPEVQKTIEKYCKQDCILTRKLAEIMHQGVKDCKIPFCKPYSRASLAEVAFLQACDIPEYLDAPKMVNKFAYWSYYGGWFELFKRGYQDGYIAEYDINSAYPYAMINQPDFRGMQWETTKHVSKDKSLGFYLVSLKPKSHCYISPLQIRTESLSVHPESNTVKYVNDVEIDMLKDTFHVKVIKGYEGFIDHPVYPLREFVLKLYDDKSRYKNNNKMMYEAVKRVLNGGYGKFIQRTGSKIGNMFNPIYASRITASCRRQIWDAVKDNQHDVIGIQTDSCIMQKDIDLNVGTELGQWSKKTYSQGIFLISGVYEMLGKQKKTKIRGYDTKMLLMETLLKYPNDNVIKIAKEKPLHLKPCYRSKDRSVCETNKFVNDIKQLSCKYDLKRQWFDEPENWKEFCDGLWDSKPLQIEYTPIHESEYQAMRRKAMQGYEDRYHDGETGMLIGK